MCVCVRAFCLLSVSKGRWLSGIYSWIMSFVMVIRQRCFRSNRWPKFPNQEKHAKNMEDLGKI